MATESILNVPATIIDRVKGCLRSIRGWNDAIRHARIMEQIAGAPGRYEHDLRETSDGASLRGEVEIAEAYLQAFEEKAREKGIKPEDVYFRLGGRPDLLAESEHVARWRRV